MLDQEEYFSDCVRHAKGGTIVPVRSTDWKVACSSPTQRKYFVCNHRLAGARHGHPFDSPDTEVSPSNYIPYNRTIYGKPTEEVLNSCGVNFDSQLFSIILSEMKNTRDKNVGATVAYDASGNATVVKMASYDRLGRKEKQWVVFMTQGMPAIQLSYEYNQSDELTHSRFEEWDGSTFVAKAERYRSYDSKGRLTKIEDENHQNIAAYEYTPNGNVKRKSYYDKGTLVYDKVIIRDVQGRPTEIRYEKNGIVLYTDKLNYETALAGRLSEAERSWKNIPYKGDKKRTGKYSYDDDGRLTKVEAPLSGEYRYDGLNGQMSYKKEGDSVIAMSYSYDKYRPAGFNINNRSPTATAEYFKYDDAGNVWYDRHAKTSYKLNAAGLPEVAYIQNNYHADLTLSDVNSGSVNDIETTMYMNYDESGQRIWTRIKTKDGDDAEFTLSGVGVYSADIGAQTGYTLKRMDLVAAGYRDGVNGKAYFPVTDAQGNVRGYANDEGLVSAYDYYAYGGVEDIVVNETDDNKRWQSKEHDEPIQKIYFGARYFDPFFGMWMSPDPAAQFANPYTYGGDPLNYVDPNGEAIIGAILSATSGIVKEAIKQKEDWWRVNRWDWGSIGNSAVAGAFIDLSGGPAGAAGTMLGFSFITRVADPDNKNRWGTIKDHFTGGAIIDWHGHFVGLNNAQYGGTVDWYRGNVVYSDGAASTFMPDNSGAEFGGHALFVQNRYNKPVIAHEIRHVQQMEKRGNRFRYAVSYIDENGGTLSPNVPEYEYNPYENDARYAQYLYEKKKIDIYGNKKGNWTHKEVAPKFREWMWRYNSFKSGGSNDKWQWKERWEYGNDF